MKLNPQKRNRIDPPIEESAANIAATQKCLKAEGSRRTDPASLLDESYQPREPNDKAQADASDRTDAVGPQDESCQLGRSDEKATVDAIKQESREGSGASLQPAPGVDLEVWAALPPEIQRELQVSAGNLAAAPKKARGQLKPGRQKPHPGSSIASFFAKKKT